MRRPVRVLIGTVSAIPSARLGRSGFGDRSSAASVVAAEQREAGCGDGLHASRGERRLVPP